MTTPTPKKTSPKRRGYLLIEVAIGGVMAAVVVGSVLELLGHANDRTAISARQETALSLANQAIEQARSAGIGLTNGSNVDVPVPTGLNGRYTRTRTVTSGTTTVSSTSPAGAAVDLLLDYKDVSVTVTFTTKQGPRTVTLQTRIYG
jgi:type II secretory pathway pseudopilin PulG